MAAKSVATKQQSVVVPGSKQDLFLRDGHCLTVSLDRNDKACPPCPDTLDDLHETILGLGKAALVIGTLLEDGLDPNRDGQDSWTLGLSLQAIANAVVLHATLAEGVSAELHRDNVPAVQSAEGRAA